MTKFKVLHECNQLLRSIGFDYLSTLLELTQPYTLVGTPVKKDRY